MAVQGKVGLGGVQSTAREKGKRRRQMVEGREYLHAEVVPSSPITESVSAVCRTAASKRACVVVVTPRNNKASVPAYFEEIPIDSEMGASFSCVTGSENNKNRHIHFTC